MQTRDIGVAEFDSYAGSYESDVKHSLYGMNPDYFTRVKADYIIDIIDSHFGQERAVHALDVGCGIANYHQKLGDRFDSLTGVDVSQASLERAAARNMNSTYRHYDGSTLPFEDQSFDVTFTICVMHHVPVTQWSGFVAEMKRVLKPGGLALIFEHNPANPLTLRIVDRCEFDQDAVLLRRNVAENLLIDGGFRQVRSRCILSLPPIGARSRNLDFAIGKLGLGAQYVAIAER